MNVVIAGINTLSERMVEELEREHDLVVVDPDKEKCEKLYSSTGATVINRNPTSLDALEDAEIGSADILITTMKEDNKNMVVASLGRKYGVPKVVSRVIDEEYRDAFEIIGAQVVGHTDILMSEFLAAVEHPNVVKMAELDDHLEIVKAEITDNSGIPGMTVEEIRQNENFPSKFEVVSVIQNDRAITDVENLSLNQNDVLVMVGPEEQKTSLNDFFG